MVGCVRIMRAVTAERRPEVGTVKRPGGFAEREKDTKIDVDNQLPWVGRRVGETPTRSFLGQFLLLEGGLFVDQHFTLHRVTIH